MYDYIKCEYPLPDGFQPRFNLSDWADGVFQTKSFEDPIMDLYIIQQDGKLVHEERHFEDVPEEERPYYGTPEWDTDKFLRFIGSQRVTSTKRVYKKEFTGVVNFYGDDKKGNWHEYNAEFVKGILQSITYIPQYWPNLFEIYIIPEKAYARKKR